MRGEKIVAPDPALTERRVVGRFVAIVCRHSLCQGSVVVPKAGGRVHAVPTVSPPTVAAKAQPPSRLPAPAPCSNAARKPSLYSIRQSEASAPAACPEFRQKCLISSTKSSKVVYNFGQKSYLVHRRDRVSNTSASKWEPGMKAFAGGDDDRHVEARCLRGSGGDTDIIVLEGEAHGPDCVRLRCAVGQPPVLLVEMARLAIV